MDLCGCCLFVKKIQTIFFSNVSYFHSICRWLSCVAPPSTVPVCCIPKPPKSFGSISVSMSTDDFTSGRPGECNTRPRCGLWHVAFAGCFKCDVAGGTEARRCYGCTYGRYCSIIVFDEKEIDGIAVFRGAYQSQGIARKGRVVEFDEYVEVLLSGACKALSRCFGRRGSDFYFHIAEMFSCRGISQPGPTRLCMRPASLRAPFTPRP